MVYPGVHGVPLVHGVPGVQQVLRGLCLPSIKQSAVEVQSSVLVLRVYFYKSVKHISNRQIVSFSAAVCVQRGAEPPSVVFTQELR